MSIKKSNEKLLTKSSGAVTIWGTDPITSEKAHENTKF